MINEPEHSISEQMLDRGLLTRVDDTTVDGFLADEGLCLLFFAGPRSVRREAHDVAVALRELLQSYGPALRAALVDPAAETALVQRFRAQATPSLVFIAGGETLEVMPRVRDWADYADAFRRFLGAPPADLKTGTAS